MLHLNAAEGNAPGARAACFQPMDFERRCFRVGVDLLACMREVIVFDVVRSVHSHLCYRPSAGPREPWEQECSPHLSLPFYQRAQYLLPHTSYPFFSQQLLVEGAGEHLEEY